MVQRERGVVGVAMVVVVVVCVMMMMEPKKLTAQDVEHLTPCHGRNHIPSDERLHRGLEAQHHHKSHRQGHRIPTVGSGTCGYRL